MTVFVHSVCKVSDDRTSFDETTNERTTTIDLGVTDKNNNNEIKPNVAVRVSE